MLFEIFWVGVIARAHETIFVCRFALTHHWVFLRLTVAAGLLISVQRRRLNMVNQRWSSHHIFQTFFLNFLHISLVLEHFPDVFYLSDVLLSGLFELLVILDEELIFFSLWVVWWMLLVIKLPHVHRLRFFYKLISQNNFFQKLFFCLKLINFKELRSSYLI